MRTLRLFAMGSDEGYISPYLLRPLRTLEEVLGGRGRTVEAVRGGVKATPTGGDQGVQSKTELQNARPASLGTAD
jgi:hypothetical protein